jgi:hypothetical protein
MAVIVILIGGLSGVLPLVSILYVVGTFSASGTLGDI